MIQKKIPLAKIVFRAMIVVILLLLLVSFIYPLFWMIISALKTNTEIFTTSYQLPKIPQWKNFVKVWNVGVKDYFLNSIIMTVASCLLTTAISGFAAFALCRYRFRARHAILMRSINKRMTNKGGWRDCEMRLWLNETIFHMLPDELQEIIVPRRIVQIMDGERLESEDKLWLVGCL